jgi:hypothetical protein
MAFQPTPTEDLVVCRLELDKHSTALQYPVASSYIHTPFFIHNRSCQPT